MIKLLNKLWFAAIYPKKQFFTIEVFSENKGLVYALARYVKKQKVVTLVETQQFNQLEEIPAILKKKTSLIWIFNSNELLFVSAKDLKSDNLNPLFSNSNPKDFYAQNEAGFITLCRKNTVDDFIKKIEKETFSISNFYLGYQPILNLLQFFPNNCRLPFLTFSHKNGRIESFKQHQNKGRETISIDGYDLQNNEVLGFAAVLNYLSTQGKYKSNLKKEENQIIAHPVKAFHHLQGTFKNRHWNKMLSKKILLQIIPLSLIFLLLNAVGLFFFKSRLAALEIENQYQQIQLQKVKTQEQRIATKKNLLTRYQNQADSEATFFIDKLLSTLPSNLIINSLVYQPKKNNPDADDTVNVETNTVLVEGIVNLKKDFNLWMETLKKIDRIQTVRIEHYGFLNQQQLLFKIKINIKAKNNESKK